MPPWTGKGRRLGHRLHVMGLSSLSLVVIVVVSILLSIPSPTGAFQPSIVVNDRRRGLRLFVSSNDEATDGPLEIGSKKDNDSDSPPSQWELLQKLDASFDYNGRMPLTAAVATTATDSTNGMPFNDDDNKNDDESNLYRCGFVAILGAPNMGKSTLLNALLECDVSICTSRPQTTRHAILGILTTNRTQVCLIDTPGVIANPAYKLQEGMMEAVTTAVRDADVLLVVTDVDSTPIANDKLFARVQTTNKPVIVVINKIDLANNNIRPVSVEQSVPPVSQTDSEDEPSPRIKQTVEQAVATWRLLIPHAVAILPVAASRGWNEPGVVALRRLLCGDDRANLAAALRNMGRPIPGMWRLDDSSDSSNSLYQDGNGNDEKDNSQLLLLPLSPPLYDADALTDRTERFVASELIRAALFETLQKELPYCCEVQVTEFKDPTASSTAVTTVAASSKSVIRIAANVIVERDSQKVIVIGKNGAQIKQVGVIARTKLEDFLQSQVFLTLNVKVDKDWRSKESQLKAYGYMN